MPVTALQNRVQQGHPEAVEKLTAKLQWRRVGESGYSDAGNVKDYSDATARSTVRRARSEGGMRNVDNEQADVNHEAYAFTLDERSAEHEPLIKLAKGLSDSQQSAVEGATAVIEEITLGCWFEIGAFNIGNAKVTSEGAGELIADLDYKLDAENGRIQFLGGHAQNGEDVLITFDQPSLSFERAQSQQTGAFLCDLIFEEFNQFSRVPLRRTEGRFFLNVIAFPQQSGEFGNYRIKATPGDPTFKTKRTVAEAIAEVPETGEPAESSSSSSQSSKSSYSSQSSYSSNSSSSTNTSQSSYSSQSSSSSSSPSSQSSSSSSTAASVSSSSSSGSSQSSSSSSTFALPSSASSQSSPSSASSLSSNSSSSSPELGNGLAPGLQFFLELDEASGNALDSSGHGRTFFENQTVPSSEDGGNRDGARQFTYASPEAYLYLASQPSVEIHTGRFSMCGWIKLDEIHDGVILAKADGGLSGGLSWLFAFDYNSPESGFVFYHSSDGNSWDGVASVNPLHGAATNQWYFVWVVQEDSLLRIGVWEKGEGSFNEAIFTPVSLYLNSVNVTVGNWSTLGVANGVNCLRGSIDDIGFWKNVALSECQITKLFNSGNGLDPSQFDSLTCG